MSQSFESISWSAAETGPHKELARRFWLMWRQGQRPNLKEFLREAGPLDPLHLVYLLRVDQRERWLTNESIPVEDYLRQYADYLQNQEEAIIDLIFGEFLLREELGEKPTPAEYQRRFPHYGEQLSTQIELHQALASGSFQNTSRLATVRLRSSGTPTSSLAPLERPGGQAEGSGVKIAGYQIIEELGRGGMGVVYLAQQLSLKRLVALKMILAEKHAGSEEKQRFQAEAQAAAKLQHPHIVQIYEIAESDGRPYFCLEFVDGGSLAQKINGVPQSARSAAQLVSTLAQTMHFAHQRGIIHRDLKPANVLLTKDGTPKITDFGLAKHLDTDTKQTRSGAIVGTPAYMAPEQAEGRTKDIGPATDVSALGAILYELLTGRPPFQGETPIDTLLMVRCAEPVPPRRLQPKVPRDLEVICLKCLRKDPHQRFADAQALADDLDRFLIGEPIKARPVSALERSLKWIRNQPAAMALIFGVAALVVGSGVALLFANPVMALISIMVPVLALLFGGALWQWRQAVSQKEQAEEQRQQAEAARRESENHRQRAEAARHEAEEQAKQKSVALDKAERNLYFHSIALAERAWLANNVRHAEEILEGCNKTMCRWEWYYLKWLCHASLLTLSGQDELIRAAVFSPDRARLVTADGRARTVRLWEVRNGQELFRLEGHTGCVNSVAFSSDGLYVASGSDDETARVWDATTGKELLNLRGHSDPVLAVAFSPDGLLLASASRDHTVKVWDARNGRKIGTLSAGHVDAVTTVAFSPDGAFLATGSADHLVKVWNARTGQPVASCRGHAESVWSVAFSPDGRLLASASADKTIKVWDPQTGQEVRTIPGHSDSVLGLAFSPDGRFLASASKDQTIRIWEARSGADVRILRGHTDAVISIAYSSDGQRLVTSGADRTVQVWDANSDLEAFTLLRAVTDPINRVVFHPDGRRLALLSGQMAGRVQIFNTATDQELFVLGGTDNSLVCAAFSPNGRELAVGGSDLTQSRGEVRICDAVTGEEKYSCPGHGRAVVSLSFSADSRRLASASADGTVKVWNTSTGQEILNYRGHGGPVSYVAFSPSGRRLASAGVDLKKCQAEIKVWDAQTGNEVFTLLGHAEPVTSLAYSPDGGKLASSSGDRTIKVWDTQTGQEILALTGHHDEVSAVVFSNCGQRLVSASKDKTVKVWGAITGREVLTLEGHSGPVTHVTFSPDGWCLVSASTDRTVKVWDAAPWEPHKDPQEPAAPAEEASQWETDLPPVPAKAAGSPLATFDSLVAQARAPHEGPEGSSTP